MDCIKKRIAEIKGVVTRLPEFHFTAPVNWCIEEGQQWAVVGPNGAGKSLLAGILCRDFACQEGEVVYEQEGHAGAFIKRIAFKDIYSLADCRNTYYQQRWQATENDDVPTVAELLQAYAGSERFAELLALFGVEALLSKRVVYLSSGELRKFFIVRALLSDPRILILDNPFIGLDTPSRELLLEMLDQLSRLQGVQVVLLLSNPKEIPAMITHVLPVRAKSCLPVRSRAEFLADQSLIDTLFPSGGAKDAGEPDELELPVDPEWQPSTHEVTLRMEQVQVRYGSRTILQDVNWEVKNGEKWALFGENGSGKSTLLSLVYADHPQSYANKICLFDRKRGSGESIWEIKKRIGYVSPEMHLYFKENVSALRIVCSGFFDSVGLYQHCQAEQEVVALRWMRLLGVDSLKDRLFQTLSTGEQRLVLLARAFVKDPDLIILDEPLHGLDVSNKRRVTALIERFCGRPGKTLIYVTHHPLELPECVDRCIRL